MNHADKVVMILQDINLDPEVFKQFKNLNQQDVTDQLAQFGMTPEDVLQKIMADPELARAFTNPTVQQAIMEAQSDPTAIAKYMDNPDIMMVRLFFLILSIRRLISWWASSK